MRISDWSSDVCSSDLADGHAEVHLPWGSYRTLDRGPGFQVKQIRVNPGGRLSLQSHRHRAEHWVVIEGTARVTRGPDRDSLETVDLARNRSIDIPLGWIHRLENPTEEPVADRKSTRLNSSH